MSVRVQSRRRATKPRPLPAYADAHERFEGAVGDLLRARPSAGTISETLRLLREAMQKSRPDAPDEAIARADSVLFALQEALADPRPSPFTSTSQLEQERIGQRAALRLLSYAATQARSALGYEPRGWEERAVLHLVRDAITRERVLGAKDPAARGARTKEPIVERGADISELAILVPTLEVVDGKPTPARLAAVTEALTRFAAANGRVFVSAKVPHASGSRRTGASQCSCAMCTAKRIQRTAARALGR